MFAIVNAAFTDMAAFTVDEPLTINDPPSVVVPVTPNVLRRFAAPVTPNVLRAFVAPVIPSVLERFIAPVNVFAPASVCADVLTSPLVELFASAIVNVDQ